jgi:DNA polymerase epsilon subunit 1
MAAASTYQRQLRQSREEAGARRSGPGSLLSGDKAAQRAWEATLDEAAGYVRMEDGPERIGYLTNMLPTSIARGEDRAERSAMELFLLEQDGSTFKATVVHEPYFFVSCTPKWLREVRASLERKFEGLLAAVDAVEKEDLDMANHLSGRRRPFLRLRFRSVAELMDVRAALRPIVERNVRRAARPDAVDLERVRGAPTARRAARFKHAPPPPLPLRSATGGRAAGRHLGRAR